MPWIFTLILVHKTFLGIPREHYKFIGVKKLVGSGELFWLCLLAFFTFWSRENLSGICREKCDTLEKLENALLGGFPGEVFAILRKLKISTV